MTEIKKVRATLISWDSQKNNGTLHAEGITPDIYINKKILNDKKCTNLNPKVGDEFEVEIKPSTYAKKPSWEIISIKAIQRKLMLQNFAVNLHKVRLFQEQENNDNQTKKTKPKEVKSKNEKTGKFQLRKLKDLYPEFKLQNIFGNTNDTQVQKYYQDICNRDKDLAMALTGNRLKVQTFQPQVHLVVGLGGASVHETDLTLHHIYGFPYLPASGIKGMLRSYLITQYFEGNEGKAFQNKTMCDIFGCPKEIQIGKDSREQYKLRYGKNAEINQTYTTSYNKEVQGKIIFFDAMPTQSPEKYITLDIMNPHFQEYYSNNQAPDDFQNPVPVFFLKIQKLSFQVMVGLLPGAENTRIEEFMGKKNTDLLTLTADLLAEAMQNFGIGAKTALGYGYMEKIK
ncbi:MAG: type III-B CRISPR module RAMP protein Cmr6 [Bacteroidia bacterium]|nr:type III-B CRISPR module RAMP protein Cmr6 [Bacteroidia bacterium]